MDFPIDPRKVKLRLDRSHSSLHSAELLLKGKEYRDSVSSSYYAMFYAVKALILLEGKDVKTHKGVRTIFGKKFIKTGKLEKEIGEMLSRLEEERIMADYKFAVKIDRKRARLALKTGRSFVQRIEKFIKEKYGIVLVVQK